MAIVAKRIGVCGMLVASRVMIVSEHAAARRAARGNENVKKVRAKIARREAKIVKIDQKLAALTNAPKITNAPIISGSPRKNSKKRAHGSYKAIPVTKESWEDRGLGMSRRCASNDPKIIRGEDRRDFSPPAIRTAEVSLMRHQTMIAQKNENVIPPKNFGAFIQTTSEEKARIEAREKAKIEASKVASTSAVESAKAAAKKASAELKAIEEEIAKLKAGLSTK